MLKHRFGIAVLLAGTNMTAKSLFIGGAAVALSLLGVIQAPERAAASPFLGTAESFAVLGASAVGNTTATTINGDVGVPLRVRSQIRGRSH